MTQQQIKTFGDEARKYAETGDYTGLTMFGDKESSWCGLGTYDALELLFDKIPDAQKWQIVTDAYQGTKLASRKFVKYLKAVRGLVPADEQQRIQQLADSDGNITVYRGGVAVKNPALCPSWTISRETGEWFAKRYFSEDGKWYVKQFLGLEVSGTVLYRAMIKPADVIAYLTERNEAEIVQYRGVFGVKVMGEYRQAEYEPPQA